ncbi:MAG: hypothetical protein AB7N76_00675 [Planctomycetota bacterium]
MANGNPPPPPRRPGPPNRPPGPPPPPNRGPRDSGRSGPPPGGGQPGGSPSGRRASGRPSSSDESRRGPADSARRPGLPPGARPAGPPPGGVDPLDLPPPAPPPPQADESQLVFMTHALGAGPLPQREDEISTEDSFAGRILGTVARRLGPSEGKQKSSTDRTTRSTSGIHALERTLQASVRQTRKRRTAPPADQTLAGASKHIVEQAPEVGPAAPAIDPSFRTLVGGAFALPLRGFPVAVVHAAMVTLALLLYELSPPLGLLAFVLAAIELVSLRTRMVRDACAGRDRVSWPEASEVAPSAGLALAAALLLLPGMLCLGADWGRPAFDRASSTSLLARAKRLVQPTVAALPGEKQGERSFGHNTLLALEALVARAPGDPLRPTADVARDLQTAVAARARWLARLDPQRPFGAAGRALFVLGFLLYPMALLAAIRLRSVYAAIYLPIVLRSSLQVPGAYSLVLVAYIAYWAAVTGAALFLPTVLREQLGAGGGHVAWALAVGVTLVFAKMVLSGLLGRLYRSRQLSLGWD